MPFVLQLRGSNISRPVTRFHRHAAHTLCALRFCLALFGLLCVVMERPLIGVPADGGVLGLLCRLLTAAVSVTLGLLLDTSRELSEWLSLDPSPVWWLSQGARRWLAEPLSPLALYRDNSNLTVLSWYSATLLALLSAALSPLGCAFGRGEPETRTGER